jgi:hypothetical protein
MAVRRGRAKEPPDPDLSRRLAYEGPLVFSSEELAVRDDLFRHRAALFFTPTSHLPARFVGEGPLRARLPLAVPTFYNYREIPGLRSPRLWVDLLQRATQKIRWRPMWPARVTIECFDVDRWSGNRIGQKGLVDALKRVTTGRRDRCILHYFGAIEDDGPDFIDGAGEVSEHLIDDPAQAHCVVTVHPA